MLHSVEFYDHFRTNIFARFIEDSRETRATLRDLLGIAIHLAARAGSQELSGVSRNDRFGYLARSPLAVFQESAYGAA